MYKRTKGYILLALLVITGLASQVTNETLNSKERRYLVKHLKDSKNAYLKSVKGLSEKQLHFKPAADKWNVKECMEHLALSEEGLWAMASGALSQPANPDKRKEIKNTDEDILKTAVNREQKLQAPEALQPTGARWATADAALNDFKTGRNKTIIYIKTTTNDVRNHVTQMAFGAMDAYQVALLMSAHTQRHTTQIEAIKAHPAFPNE